MNEEQRRMLAQALMLREGEWNASQKQHGKPSAQSLLQTPEMGSILPEMHKGKMLNLMERGWTDGKAHSLDLYLQPKISPRGMGINGGGLLYRRVW